MQLTAVGLAIGSAVRSALAVSRGASVVVPPASNHLLTESGLFLTDESGNQLTA